MTSSPTHYAYLLRAALTAACGGLLFGYDTAVIAGTVEFLQSHFQLSDMMLGWVVSSALLGCVVGAAGSGWLGDRLGRKRTMLICAVLFFISAVWSGLARGPQELALARILGGFGVGAASLLTPVYIAEISPPRIRGALTTLNQVAILVGMVIVYLVNAQLASVGDEAWRITTAWRWMFGSEALPAFVFLVLLAAVPESPRWLALNGFHDRAVDVIKRIGGTDDPEETVREIAASKARSEVGWAAMLRPPFHSILFTGAALAILQQATGINIVMYYAPRIFTAAGLDTTSAIGHSVLIGLVMLFFTGFALVLADRCGRRPLLLLSAVGMTIGLGVLGWIFEEGRTDNAGALLLWILVYVASFSIGMGPLVWTVIAEIFPNAMRGRAVGICVLLLWLANFAVSQFFPQLLATFGAHTFWFYGAFGVLAIALIHFRVHETKGKSLEAITREEMDY